eukprot:GFUD01001739.1.p1 GENE.GFUD01001739.1~~GFUD01001739.1.p1  ORF type:complete len:356 (-),score=85.07 GFUD01001739.1:11-1078(-)
MSDKAKESVIIENTPCESDLLIKKVNEKEEEKSAKSVEIFLGCILVSVAIMVTVFSFVLLQEFEVVPTNLVFVKSILQLLLFTISNKNNSISVKPADSRDAAIIAVQGLLSGLAFICSIGAVRLLPLGDVFSIMFSKTVFLMLLMSGFAGNMTKKKLAVTMVSMLGLVVLIINQTRYNVHQNGLIEVVNPLVDPYSSIWVGIGLALLHNMFSSMAEVLRLDTKAAAGVLSFWSAVGGLVVAALSTFVSSEPSILSGVIPSVMQLFLLVFLSISAIAVMVITAAADGLVSKTFVTAIRSIEIPTAMIISLALTIDYIPNYVGYVGVVFIVISSVLAQATMEDEEKEENSTDVHEFV